MSSSSLPPSPGSQQRVSATTIAILILSGLTVFRLWYSTRLELVGDETYYWLWSKHLAASYVDKGPAIAWIIRAGTLLFGNTAFGIRFFGVLLSAGTGWQIFRLAQRLYDDPTALGSLIVACLIPLFGVGSVLMTIDSPSVFCWAWAINVFWSAVNSGKLRHWIAVGLIVGAGFLAKFTNGVQLGCVGLFLLWSAPHRRFVLSRQTVAMAIAFTLCLTPVIWWNAHVGWLQVGALHSRSGVEHSFQIHPLQFLRFVGEQLGVISPLVGLGMGIAAVGLWLTRRSEPRTKLLLTQYVPLYAIFGFFSLNYAGKGNWPAPALIAGIVLLVTFWRDLARQRANWRWAPATALAIAGVMTVALNIAPFVSWPWTNSIVRRCRGWKDFAAHIERARQNYPSTLLIANHYNQASLAEFYLPDQPRVCQPSGWNAQYQLWGDYKLSPGTRALYVTSEIRSDPNQLKSPLPEQFKTRTLVDDFWSEADGAKVSHFRIYWLEADQAYPKDEDSAKESPRSSAVP